jgi:hypothetical protein
MRDRMSPSADETSNRWGIFLAVAVLVVAAGLTGGIIALLALVPVAIGIGLWMLFMRGSSQQQVLESGVTQSEAEEDAHAEPGPQNTDDLEDGQEMRKSA